MNVRLHNFIYFFKIGKKQRRGFKNKIRGFSIIIIYSMDKNGRFTLTDTLD